MAFEFVSNNLSFFIFVMILSLFLLWKKKNLELSGTFPILYIFLYKTKLGLDKMRNWSQKHKRFFKIVSNISIFVAIFGFIAMTIFMLWQLGYIVSHGVTQGGGLVLPLKTEKGLESSVPIFYVPFWYWIIALSVLIIVHEFAHGVIAESFKVKVKSSGLAFFGILVPFVPGAFVEPDEKALKEKPKWQQIAVFGAGSTSNFIFGAFFLLLWLFVAGPFVNATFDVNNITFTSVMNQSSLNEFNITSGNIISLDGIEDKKQIITNLQNLSVNQSVFMEINQTNGTQLIVATTFSNPDNPEKGMIGISGLSFGLKNKEGYGFLGKFPLGFQTLLFYLWFLNIGIGMMNLLPIWITDGGQISKVVFERLFVKRKALAVYHGLSFFSLLLIIFTLWPGLLINILNLFLL